MLFSYCWLWFSFVVLVISTKSNIAIAKAPSEIYAQNSASVVSIFAKTPNAVYAGSGVVIQKNIIVTNCHVVKGARQILIGVGGQNSEATLIKRNEYVDMCVLAANIPQIEPVKVSKRSPQVGERIITIGNPKGLEKTLSDGLVSSNREFGNGLRYIQISAPITVGSSGGGLFDSEGYLIGVTTSGLGQGNLNFALPIDYLDSLKDVSVGKSKRILPSLVDEATADAIKLALNRRNDLFELPELSQHEKNDYDKFLTHQMILLKSKITIDEERRLFLQVVWYESRRAGLEPNLVLGIIDVLSNFDQFHVSKTGRKGFMSVPDDVLRNAGIDRDPVILFDRRINLRAGCIVLRKYLDDNGGDLFQALNKYADRSGESFPVKVKSSWRRYEWRTSQ